MQAIAAFLDPLIFVGALMILVSLVALFYNPMGRQKLLITFVVLGTFLVGASSVTADLIGVGSLSFVRKTQDAAEELREANSKQEALNALLSQRVSDLQERLNAIDAAAIAGNKSGSPPPAQTGRRRSNDPLNQALGASREANKSVGRALKKLTSPF